MAAIMHDYRHPGVNNGYLVRDLDPLAVTYNDVSVLENFHAAEGFKMMLDPRFDIFKVRRCVYDEWARREYRATSCRKCKGKHFTRIGTKPETSKDHVTA